MQTFQVHSGLPIWHAFRTPGLYLGRGARGPGHGPGARAPGRLHGYLTPVHCRAKRPGISDLPPETILQPAVPNGKPCDHCLLFFEKGHRGGAALLA
jgi:hypothetical protein